jgi:hypothetical protein
MLTISNLTGANTRLLSSSIPIENHTLEYFSLNSVITIIFISSILDNIADIRELLNQGFITIRSPCGWNITLSHLIASQTFFVVIFAKPVAFVLRIV